MTARFGRTMMPNYGVPSIALEHGEGCYVYDVEGNGYLDFVAGIAVSALGHNHPAISQAVKHQVDRLAHSSNLYAHGPGVALAEKLVSLMDAPAKVFFANSGAEANECALKLAISHAKATGRRYFVAAHDGFHGRTLGALALAGKPSIREPFGPYGIDVHFVPYGDVKALQDAVSSECAAVFIEPAQGEAGVVFPPPDYLAAVRRICDGTGSLYIADEIQSGIGRSGQWFAYQETGARPDILTLAKGLAGGLPLGACIAVSPYAELFDKGAHGSTFGGNPVSCAAAMAVIETIEKQGLIEKSAEMGQVLRDSVESLGHEAIQQVRGRGLWCAIQFHDDIAAPVQDAMARLGVLVNAVRPNVIRIAPPLIVKSIHIDLFVRSLTETLDEVAKKEQA